jgi:arginine decarboxylase
MDTFDLQARRESLWAALCTAARSMPFGVEAFGTALTELLPLECFWAYPGTTVLGQVQKYLAQGQYVVLAQLVANCHYQLHTRAYRQQHFVPFQSTLATLDRPVLHDAGQLASRQNGSPKPYFEVLVVHPNPVDYVPLYRHALDAIKGAQDEFVYGLVFVASAEDALTTLLANSDIQACVYLQHVAAADARSHAAFESASRALVATTAPLQAWQSVEVNLCRSARSLRPNIVHILISECTALELPHEVRSHFDRVLFHINPFQDLHAALLADVRNRFSTPFFDALQAYSRQPKSVFHALPLSRGASVKDSPWIGDMLDFYGDNMFLAETSSTQGGLDSLLDPTGAIKQAHTKAAQTFGADHSYFVTNGTSTSNKIVMQANVRPGDIVLISADCHKSVPYGVMLAGAYPIFLETYALPEHDLYGAIDLAQIKAVMLDLKAQGLLPRLKQITLTNSTFDGLVYNAEAFMMEILAIKPDVIFHWDEAWFAFGHFHPLYHSRTAMSAVRKIRERMSDAAYHRFHTQWQATFDANPAPDKWQQILYPDPMQVCVRVYATQSTHKTLTAFRQASMIHVADDVFNAGAFLEAFRIHTSTSPNYQIIASLDIARRQASLEGFQKVRDAIALAMQLRQRIAADATLTPYFDLLNDADLVPQQYRNASAGNASDASNAVTGIAALSQTWGGSDFVVDPTRITINVAGTGMDGTSFRQLLMTRYAIQINKTSRHTVLFLINIGATQASVDYLMQVLQEMAARFSQQRRNYVVQTPAVALPAKRSFHPAFLPFAPGRINACDIRTAYFDGFAGDNVTYVPLSAATLACMEGGRQWVSASFVTPYPPGFPVIVPGQIITAEIFRFFENVKVKEIHGFHAELGFKVFTDSYLANSTPHLSAHNALATALEG